MSEEEMDVEAQVAALNKALRLQNRSALQYALSQAERLPAPPHSPPR